MTDTGGKTEDYREINPYWLRRLVRHIEDCMGDYSEDELRKICRSLAAGHPLPPEFEFKAFSENIMTSGYPKSSDRHRIRRYEHAGIEIRGGRYDWGAQQGKLYFVIKHGRRIE